MRVRDAQAYFRQQLGGIEPGGDGLQRVGDNARGDIARLMSAGPVGNRPEAEIRTVHPAVLVALAGGARVARRRGTKRAGLPQIGFDRYSGHGSTGVAASSIEANLAALGNSGLAKASGGTRAAPSVRPS